MRFVAVSRLCLHVDYTSNIMHISKEEGCGRFEAHYVGKHQLHPLCIYAMTYMPLVVEV